MISRTKLKLRIGKKSNPALAATIAVAMNNKAWVKVAQFLSSGSRNQDSVNLSQIDAETKTGDTIVVLGKVLSSGDITKKLRIVALSISDSAKEKLKKTKSEFATIAEEIKINPKAEGIKVIR